MMKILPAAMVLAIAACSPTPPSAESVSNQATPSSHSPAPAPRGKSPGGFALWNISSLSAGLDGVRVMLLGNDGKPLPLTAPDAGAEGWAVWSPDGWRLATLVTSSRGTSNALHIVDTGAGTRRVLLDDGRFHAIMRWSPSGRFISLKSEDPRALAKSGAFARLDRVDVESGKVITIASSVFSEVWVGANALRIVTRAADGTWTTSLVDEAGVASPAKTLPVPSGTLEVFPSPDGARVAFVRKVAGQLQSTLAICALDGSGVVELGPVWRFGDLGWSPDGTRLAYTRLDMSETPKHELWVAAGATTTRVTRLDEFDETGEFDSSHITWSPDSTKLATLSIVDDLRLALLIADNDGANVHELTRIQGIVGGLTWRP